jgi:hypothetical protein
MQSGGCAAATQALPPDLPVMGSILASSSIVARLLSLTIMSTSRPMICDRVKQSSYH